MVQTWDIETLLVEIKSCTNSRSLEKGRRLHGELTSSGRDSNIYVRNALINMYGKCKSMEEAYKVFTGMVQHTVVSWTALILGYVENGQVILALENFSRMQLEGCSPNSLTYVAALKACTGEHGTSTSFARKGVEISAQATGTGFDSDTYVASTLVNMHAKLGRMEDARQIFDRITNRTVVSWTVCILGYVESGQPELGLVLFSCMQLEGYVPDSQCFVAAIKACSALATKETGVRVAGRTRKLDSLLKGLAVHSQASASGYDNNVFVASVLVDMYTNCGSLEDARRTFERISYRDVVLWNSMILGYTEHEDGETALSLFQCMQDEGCHPDDRSFVASLKACSCLINPNGLSLNPTVDGDKSRALETVMVIHAQALQKLQHFNRFMVSALVDVYARCGSPTDARRVFDHYHEADDVVAWNSLMTGYVEFGDGDSALELLRHMQEEGCCTPDCITYVTALKACGTKANVEVTKALHAEVSRHGLEQDPVLGSCLVDTYGKCGSLVAAEQVFESMIEQDLVTWSALITGYSGQGDSTKVVETFHRMQDQGLCPNEVTLLSVLKACNHAGLVEKGKRLFQGMLISGRGSLSPGIEHYHCMVDMLGRAYGAEEALGVVESMPFNANSVTWMTLLSVCSKWKNVTCGRVAFENLVRLGCQDLAAAYDLLGRCTR